MSDRPIKLRGIGLVVTMAAALTACAPELTDVEHVAKAKEMQDKGDLRGGIIELKSALQMNPKNPEARRLLGEIYVKAGNGPSAEKELRRALDLGVSKDAILLPLAQALALQNKHQEVLDEIQIPASLPAARQAELLTFRGDAWLGLGKAEKANADYRQALQLEPNTPLAKLGLARLAASRRNLEQASLLVDEGLQQAPEEGRLWRFKAELAKLQGDLEQAEEAYSKAIQFNYSKISDLANLAIIHINLKKIDIAKKEIDELKKKAPKYYMTKYAEGLINFNLKNYEAAIDNLNQVLKSRDHAESQLYLGWTFLNQGNYAEAERNIVEYVKKIPNSVIGLKLLALVEFRLGNFKAAQSFVRKLLQSNKNNDAELLNLAADVEFALGNLDEAIEFLGKAEVLNNNSTELEFKKSLLLLKQGETQKAQTLLKSLLASNRRYEKAYITLAASFMQEGRFDKALEVAKEFNKQFPNDSRSQTLIGVALIAKGNEVDGKRLLEKALTINPADFNATSSLAKIEIKKGSFENAENIYKEFLKKNPNNLMAILRLADISKIKGNNNERKEWLEKAIDLHPKALEPHLTLSELYFESRDYRSALKIIDGIENLYANHPDLVALKGQLELAQGMPLGAQTTLKKLVQLKPNSAKSHYLLSRSYLENKRYEDARNEIEKSLTIDPKFTDARKIKVSLLAIEKNYHEAENLITELRNDKPNDPEIIDLHAWIMLLRNKPKESLKIFTNAMSQFKDDNEWPLKVSKLQWKMGRKSDSLSTLEVWLKDHPGDDRILSALAAGYMLAGKESLAIEAYQKLLTRQPSSAVALNNLAWLHRKKDPERALNYAKQALKLKPKWLDAVDTLAVIYTEKGDVDNAIRLLQESLAEYPDSSKLQFHLAQAYLRKGEVKKAKRLLNNLKKLKQINNYVTQSKELLNEIAN